LALSVRCSSDGRKRCTIGVCPVSNGKLSVMIFHGIEREEGGVAAPIPFWK